MDEFRVKIWPRVYDQQKAGFTPAKIEPKNGNNVRVEFEDDFTQTLILDDSFVLKVDAWGYATWGGHVGSDLSRWGAKHSEEYAVVAINLALKTVLAADKDIGMNTGAAAHKEIFDVSKVVKTAECIDAVTYQNSDPNTSVGKPDVRASNIHKALDAFLVGVRIDNMHKIYENFWEALENAINFGSDTSGKNLDKKIMSITGSAPLECLRTVSNQIKHSDKVRSLKHGWKHCNCSNYEPPKLDMMPAYVGELRPLATAVILKRLNEY